jgi:hypothetical protein
MDETVWAVLSVAQGGTMAVSDESHQVGLLHRIEIYCADLKVTTEFWGWFLGLLGYAVYQHWPGGPGGYAVYFEDPDRMKVELDAPDEKALAV